MELSDEKVLETLLRSWEQDQLTRKAGRPKGPTPAPDLPTYTPQAHRIARRCLCGACPACKDNQRWERIFREKFADPDYYTRRSITIESPLSDL